MSTTLHKKARSCQPLQVYNPSRLLHKNQRKRKKKDKDLFNKNPSTKKNPTTRNLSNKTHTPNPSRKNNSKNCFKDSIPSPTLRTSLKRPHNVSYIRLKTTAVA